PTPAAAGRRGAPRRRDAEVRAAGGQVEGLEHVGVGHPVEEGDGGRGGQGHAPDPPGGRAAAVGRERPARASDRPRDPGPRPRRPAVAAPPAAGDRRGPGRAGGWLPWYTNALNEVPNAHVLQALVEQVIGGRVTLATGAEPADDDAD